MKTFYSILYCTIRPNLDEQVSNGLFVGNESTCKFQFSSEKLNIIKGLFSEGAFELVKVSLKSIQNLALECERDYLNAHKGTSTLRIDYFSYPFKVCE